MSYQSLGEFSGIKYTNVTYDSVNPMMYRWWVNQPLSSTPQIRSNICGVVPMKTVQYKSVQVDEPVDLTFAYVPSTIFPQNPNYTNTKEIILYR